MIIVNDRMYMRDFLCLKYLTIFSIYSKKKAVRVAMPLYLSGESIIKACQNKA